MDYTKLSLTNCFDLACEDFGLENEHTICIARLKEAVDNSLLTEEVATPMAQIIYHHGTESIYFNPDWDDEDEDDDWDYEEPEWNEDEGFDPYEGCYTGDC